jgi:hypothetical protein
MISYNNMNKIDPVNMTNICLNGSRRFVDKKLLCHLQIYSVEFMKNENWC